MGYKFRQPESVAVNINRIVAEQVNAAIESLENPGEGQEEMIHDVRKRIKKIRALFRLMRSELKHKDFNRRNSLYRTIGHALSPLRDASVLSKTLENLRHTYPHMLSPNQWAPIKKALAQQQNQVLANFFGDETNIRSIILAFKQAPPTAHVFHQHHTGFSILRPNLETAYRQAQKALKVANKEPSSQHYHELRKKVKTIWYHTRLLTPIWPDILKAYSKELKHLGELLGDDHDCCMLTDELKSGRLLLPNNQTKEMMLELLQHKRTKLRQQIHPLAKRLLADKAEDIVDRYHLYWKLWQLEATPELALDQH